MKGKKSGSSDHPRKSKGNSATHREEGRWLQSGRGQCLPLPNAHRLNIEGHVATPAPSSPASSSHEVNLGGGKNIKKITERSKTRSPKVNEWG